MFRGLRWTACSSKAAARTGDGVWGCGLGGEGSAGRGPQERDQVLTKEAHSFVCRHMSREARTKTLTRSRICPCLELGLPSFQNFEREMPVA